MSKVPSISFFLGLMAGILSLVVYINYSLATSVITLILSFLIFELYKRFFAGEPDFVMHFDKDDIQDGDDFSEMITKIFEEAEKREDD